MTSATAPCGTCAPCLSACGLPLNANKDGFDAFEYTVKNGFEYIESTSTCIELLELQVINIDSENNGNAGLLKIIFNQEIENINYSSKITLK